MSRYMASKGDSPDDSSKGPLEINFQPDKDSKKRKGVHRPIPAKVFTKQAIEGNKPTKVYLLINPYSGKKKGLQVS